MLSGVLQGLAGEGTPLSANHTSHSAEKDPDKDSEKMLQVSKPTPWLWEDFVLQILTCLACFLLHLDKVIQPGSLSLLSPLLSFHKQNPTSEMWVILTETTLTEQAKEQSKRSLKSVNVHNI